MVCRAPDFETHQHTHVLPSPSQWKMSKKILKDMYMYDDIWLYHPSTPPREHSHETGQAKILQKDRLPGSNSRWTTKKSIFVQNTANTKDKILLMLNSRRSK